MSCIKCNHTGETVMSDEKYPCKCGEEFVIAYHMCSQCGCLWRTMNGEVTEDSVMSFDELLSAVMPGMAVPDGEIDENMTKNFMKEISRIENIESGTASMSDLIHKCLKCDAVAHEVGQGIYKCVDCDFEWEVVKVE